MLSLQECGELIVERKRNGHSTPVLVTGQKRDDVGIYSRSIQDLTSKFPHHSEGIRALNVAPGTLLQAENVKTDEVGVERPGLITRFAGSKSERSVLLQEKVGLPTLAFFNVLMYRGESIIHWAYRDRLDLLRDLLAKNQHPALELVEVLEGSLADLQRQSVSQNWEGLVLYDAKAPTELRTDGIHDRPPRPDGCWKWKDYNEGDFVITGWVPSTSAKYKGLVRDFKIAQYDPHTGELVSWGKCGNGLSSAQKVKYANDELYPIVAEVKFESRTPNKRLTMARILRIRDDKSPSECFSPV
jgi:ATP-dependent DNA ligase